MIAVHVIAKSMREQSWPLGPQPRICLQVQDPCGRFLSDVVMSDSHVIVYIHVIAVGYVHGPPENYVLSLR